MSSLLQGEREREAREEMVQAAFYDSTLRIVVVPASKIDAYRAAVREAVIADALLGHAQQGEGDVRQTLNEVIECCQAVERDALRWLYVLRHGSLGLDEEGELVLAFSFGPANDAPYLSADEVDEVSGNKPNAKGRLSGDVLNRAIDYVRGEHAIGVPPAPPCIHERELAALRARPLPPEVQAVVDAIETMPAAETFDDGSEYVEKHEVVAVLLAHLTREAP